MSRSVMSRSRSPVWELRVHQYRIFYNIDETASEVVIRAVRPKPSPKTTEEILLKTVDIPETNLDACVAAAQSDRIIVTRGGNPIALVVDVQASTRNKPNSAAATTSGI